MRLAKILATMMLPVLLVACGPDGPNRSDSGLAVGALAGGILGSTVGRGRGRVAATVVGAVIGGIVGSEIGRNLDRRSRDLAQQAEVDAFERGRSGTVTRWRNPDNGRYGEIIPSRPYQRAQRQCRDYTHTVFIDGQRETMRGTACRSGDGTWRNVG